MNVVHFRDFLLDTYTHLHESHKKLEVVQRPCVPSGKPDAESQHLPIQSSEHFLQGSWHVSSFLHIQSLSSSGALAVPFSLHFSVSFFAEINAALQEVKDSVQPWRGVDSPIPTSEFDSLRRKPVLEVRVPKEVEKGLLRVRENSRSEIIMIINILH